MKRLLYPLIFILSVFYNSVSDAKDATVNLYASNEFGKFGDILSVDIEVNGFKEIISFQSSLNWDPTLLRYVEVSDFAIKDFNKGNFGIKSVKKGHLRFAWEPSDSKPVTLKKTVLFKVYFEVLATKKQKIPIGFVDVTSKPAFVTEFANRKYEVLKVNTHEGKIKVAEEALDLVNLHSTPNTSCDSRAPNGSLKADVYGDSVNYMFYWFEGNNIEGAPNHIGYLYDNLYDGVYTLQILDKKQDVFVESISTEVDDKSNYQSDDIKLISVTDQTSCSTNPEKQTGSIEISVNDTQSADMFMISWWRGRFEDNQELMDYRNVFKAKRLAAGNYEVVVENKSNGCRSYLKETIMEDKVQFELDLSSTNNNYCKEGMNGSVTAAISGPEDLDLKYYWFRENDQIDTTKAIHKKATYEGLGAGSYKSWVIDLESDCYVSGTAVVEDSLVYAELSVSQRNDTLFANDDRANWFRNGIFLQKTGSFIVPEKTGNYSITVMNEFGCFNESEDLFYGVTGLEDPGNDINLFPNPFNEVIRISNQDGVLEFVKIFNAQGGLISENFDIKNKFIDIYLSDSPNGIYFVRIRKKGKVLTRKIVKNLP